MQTVGNFLRAEAINCQIPEDADDFGRSAFNRYYYSAYLHVRDNIGKFDTDWVKAPHASLPNTLTGALMKKIKDKIKTLKKKQLLSASQAESLKSRAFQSTAALSDILCEAYSVRVDADYNRATIPIDRQNNQISLAGMTLGNAAAWRKKVDRAMGELLAVWSQLG